MGSATPHRYTLPDFGWVRRKGERRQRTPSCWGDGLCLGVYGLRVCVCAKLLFSSVVYFPFLLLGKTELKHQSKRWSCINCTLIAGQNAKLHLFYTLNPTSFNRFIFLECSPYVLSGQEITGHKMKNPKQQKQVMINMPTWETQHQYLHTFFGKNSLTGLTSKDNLLI